MFYSERINYNRFFFLHLINKGELNNIIIQSVFSSIQKNANQFRKKYFLASLVDSSGRIELSRGDMCALFENQYRKSHITAHILSKYIVMLMLCPYWAMLMIHANDFEASFDN